MKSLVSHKGKEKAANDFIRVSLLVSTYNSLKSSNLSTPLRTPQGVATLIRVHSYHRQTCGFLIWTKVIIKLTYGLCQTFRGLSCSFQGKVDCSHWQSEVVKIVEGRSRGEPLVLIVMCNYGEVSQCFAFTCLLCLSPSITCMFTYMSTYFYEMRILHIINGPAVVFVKVIEV